MKKNQDNILEEYQGRVLKKRGIRICFLLCGFMWASTSLMHSLTGFLHLPRSLTVNSTPPLPERIFFLCVLAVRKGAKYLTLAIASKNLCKKWHKTCRCAVDQIFVGSIHSISVSYIGQISKGLRESVYMWFTQWIYVVHKAMKPIIAAVFIFCLILWRTDVCDAGLLSQVAVWIRQIIISSSNPW